uniref:Protein kinase domain-containing protein n=1 Tax=Daucus carota subsp. sativus TaxID=79200 RepID=A0A161WWY1_DAUCS
MVKLLNSDYKTLISFSLSYDLKINVRSSPLQSLVQLSPNNSAAPVKNVQGIVPSLSFSTSHGKPPHVEGPNLAPEDPEQMAPPPEEILQIPPSDDPLAQKITPSSFPVPAASPPLNLLIEPLPNQRGAQGIPPSNSPVPSASPSSKLPSYSAPVRPLLPEFPPSNSPGPDISSVATPLPIFKQKGGGKPIAAPSNGTPKQVSPLDSPTKAPVQSFPKGSSVAPLPHLKMESSSASTSKDPDVALVSTRPPSFDQKRVKMPVAAPSKGILKQLSPLDHSSSEGNDWKKNGLAVAVPSYGSPKKLLPQVNNPVKANAAPPSYSPKVYEDSRQKSNALPTLNAAKSALPPVSPPRVPASQEMTIPPFPPQNSPSGTSSPENPMVPYLPHIPELRPPPLSEDCESLSCREPFTNNPSGSPCGCVLAMQVGLRLDLPLYAFFPLVSDLAADISRGIVMKQSQVRIMGANADSQNQEKTVVLLDLVPFGAKFDNSTAYLIYKKFYQKEVAIEPLYFGNYEILYMRYPGLPASPPALSTFGGEAYSGQGSKKRPFKPLAVDVNRQRHKKGLKGSVIAMIVLVASLSLILCCAVAWVMLFRHRREKAQPELNLTSPTPSLEESLRFAVSKISTGLSSISPTYKSGLSPYTGTAKTFTVIDIERATDSFNASRIIGEGGFGIVYSGVLDDGTKVAVKVLKRDNQQGGREFLAEVEMLSRLHHRNLVKLVGICMEEHARCLVYELIANGSVESHLHGFDKTDAPLDWNARLKVALGAARGLAYLHEDSSPRVIHRDFKSSNILLEHDFTPKVSDFGLARIGSDEENKHISTRVMGTFGYVAPEYAMTGHLLVKSDVYSYGVVLLELITGRKPVDMSRPTGQENLVTWARPLLTSKEGLELMLDKSLSPDFPFESFAKVAAIASMCVQPEVSDRPFMSEVVQALKLICNELCTTNNFESRFCSPEQISTYFDARPSTASGYMPYHLQSPFSDVEWGLRASEVFSSSARFDRTGSRPFRGHSSPGPMRNRRTLPFLSRIKGWSGGSTSNQRAILGLWSRSN